MSSQLQDFTDKIKSKMAGADKALDCRRLQNVVGRVSPKVIGILSSWQAGSWGSLGFS